MTTTFRHDFPYTPALRAVKGTQLRKSGDRTITGRMPKGVPTGPGQVAPKDPGNFTAEIDAAGRLSTLRVDLTVPGSGQRGAITFGYADYGTPVHLATPAASDVVEDEGRWWPILPAL